MRSERSWLKQVTRTRDNFFLMRMLSVITRRVGKALVGRANQKGGSATNAPEYYHRTFIGHTVAMRNSLIKPR